MTAAAGLVAADEGTFQTITNDTPMWVARSVVGRLACDAVL